MRRDQTWIENRVHFRQKGKQFHEGAVSATCVHSCVWIPGRPGWLWETYYCESQSNKFQVHWSGQNASFHTWKSGSSEMLRDLPQAAKLVSDGTDSKVMSPDSRCAPEIFWLNAWPLLRDQLFSHHQKELFSSPFLYTQQSYFFNSPLLWTVARASRLERPKRLP